jgi:hypothetical protein
VAGRVGRGFLRFPRGPSRALTHHHVGVRRLPIDVPGPRLARRWEGPYLNRCVAPVLEARGEHAAVAAIHALQDASKRQDRRRNRQLSLIACNCSVTERASVCCLGGGSPHELHDIIAWTHILLTFDPGVEVYVSAAGPGAQPCVTVSRPRCKDDISHLSEEVTSFKTRPLTSDQHPSTYRRGEPNEETRDASVGTVHRYVTVDERHFTTVVNRPTMLDTGRAGYHCPRVSN